jgi:hypothetical protein
MSNDVSDFAHVHVCADESVFVLLTTLRMPIWYVILSFPRVYRFVVSCVLLLVSAVLLFGAGERCLYAHGAVEMREDATGTTPGNSVETNSRYKTRLCKHWVASNGTSCPHGAYTTTDKVSPLSILCCVPRYSPFISQLQV